MSYVGAWRPFEIAMANRARQNRTRSQRLRLTESQLLMDAVVLLERLKEPEVWTADAKLRTESRVWMADPQLRMEARVVLERLKKPSPPPPLLPPLPQLPLSGLLLRRHASTPAMPMCFEDLMSRLHATLATLNELELVVKMNDTPRRPRPPTPPQSDEFSGDTCDYDLEAIFDPTRKHMTWCGICGQNRNPLISCITCCSSYHASCIHNVAKNNGAVPYIIEYVSKCYYCTLNPNYRDNAVVWHKLPSYSWWPARVLPYTEKPNCLKSPPSKYHVPLCYYGQKKYSWAHRYDICSFVINAAQIKDLNPLFPSAVEEATKDYQRREVADKNL